MGGCAGDMRLCMNEIAMINPNSRFLLSTANEGKKTLADIEKSGRRLAKEILDYLTGPNEDSPGSVAQDVLKISIICFSLGGIIV